MKLLQVHAIAGLNSKTSLSLFTLFTILLVGAAHAEHNGDAGGLRRRPFARIRAWARGMDLEVRTGNMVGACQTTPVAKQELQNQEGMCRIAFFTAAHCVVGDNNQLFSAIRIPGIGEIPSQSIKTEIPREYFNTAQSDPRAPRQGDTATLVFDIPCEKVTDITPVPLAAINNDGTTRIDTAQVYLQKRDSSAPGNRGGGSQIVANHAKSDDPNKFRFDVPSPQGFAIVGGDSGGPIFNAKGELVCPISASSYEYKRSTGQVSRPRLDDNSVLDPFTVVCDNRAIGRLKNQLANYGLAPVSAELLADSPSPSQRPFAASLGDSDFGSHSNAPLTAEEVQRGGWVPDPNGTCDLERGCAFKNPKGEVRFLPNSEKKKLEQAHTSEQPQRTPRPRTAQSSGPQEMNSLNDWNAAFANNADKDGLVMIFSAENCGPCKQLQSQLPGLNKPGVSIFTATRPTYQTTQGHELHERFSKTLGGSVPAAFVYTKNAEGKWEGKVVRGAPNILAAVKGIKSSTNRDVAQTPSQSAPQAQSTPATPATPAPSRQYEFEAGPSNGLFMKTAEAEPESLFLKRQADGTRRAAVKNTDGTHTVLPQDAQTALKNYYESRANDVRRLSAQKQRYIKEFLSGFETGTPAEEPERIFSRGNSTRGGTAGTPSQSLPSGASAGTQHSPAQQAPAQTGATQTGSPKQTTNKGYRNAIPQTAGRVPTHQEAGPSLETTAPRNPDVDKNKNPLHAAIGRCVDCHSADSGRTLTLPSDPEEALKSLKGKISTFGPVNKEMISKMAESSIHGALNEKEKAELYQYLFGTSNLNQVAKLEEPSRIPRQIMDPQKVAAVKEGLPQTTNPFIDSVLKSPSTVFYTDAEMPPVYQIGKDSYGAGEGIKYLRNESNLGPLGWDDIFKRDPKSGQVTFKGVLGSPAGLHDASSADYKTTKFFRLPTSQGKMAPITVSQLPSGIDSHLDEMKYPAGTVFGEVVSVKDPTTGKDRVLEIRTRTHSGNNQWQPDIYRPFPTSQSLVKRIKEEWSGDAWKQDPELSRLVRHLEGGAPLQEKAVQSNYAVPVFSGKGGVDNLPELAPEKVARLLDGTTFDSSLNKRWREDGAVQSFAPTTQSNFHIVPKSFSAHSLEVSSESCMRCHQNTGTNFGVLFPNAHRNDGARFAYPDAYGHSYGSSTVNSFNPYPLGAANLFGNGPQGALTDNRVAPNGRTKVRPQFLEDGIIQYGR